MNLKHGILLSVIFLLLAFSANGIEFEACSPPGESINAASGHISSLNFPNNYDANRICTWNITVPGGKIIKLTFLNFTLVAGENDDCAGAAADSARVFITNVASHGGNPNDFKICGQKLPPPVYSEGNFIQVRFESRTGPVNKGFNATFEAIDEDSLCPTDVILDETSGSFSTPFNPRNYPFNQTCSWKIIGKQGYHVELSLPDDNIQRCGGIACSCDYMEVQNSFSDQVPPGKLCGTPRFIPVIFYSLHESLRVVFVSDDTSMDFDGFEATYRLLNYSPPICPREAIPLSGSGKISSTNYPKSNYTASRDCTWNITAPADKIVKFTFTDFVLSECSDSHCSDSCSYVELYDGGSTSSPLLGRFCQGSSWNETQLSSGNQMFVMFHPGQTVDRGFEAKYESTTTGGDLIAYYPLNGEFEAREIDNRQPAGVLGQVELTTGPHGETNGSYQFSGNPNSFIEFPNDGGLDTLHSITLMCWVQPGGRDGPLFNYKNSGAWGVHIWIVNGTFFDRITKYPNHAFFDAIWTDQALPVGQWAHVAATYDHITGVNSLYVNGHLSKTKYIGKTDRISTNDGQVRMGVKIGDSRYFNGKIAQMKVFDVALDEADIKAAMNEGLDPCSEYPCANDGTCVDNGNNAFECICPPGVTGDRCQVRLDPCSRDPCVNNGTCVDNRDNTFQCICPPGVTGYRCQVRIDPCSEYPCANNGTCADNGNNTFKCICPPDVTGDRCQVGLDPCSEYPCTNNGTCVDNGNNTFKCICPPGVTGDRCQVGLDPCSEYPCANNGTCVDNGNNTFKCICPPGVTGDLCQVDIDECRENKDHCQDICENTMGSYYCSCSDPELSVARDKRNCIAAGVEVDCGQDEMTITLPKSLLLGLDREHLRLIDANCTATENKTHFFLHTETGKCGTILKHNKDYVIYSNMVSEIPTEENKIVTRLRQAMIPFHCFYSNWGAVSSIGIRPSSTKIVFSSRGFGKFTLSLDLFRSSQFIAPFSQDDFPVEFTIRERVYFETRVDSEDSTLSILALNCYATPNQDRNSQPRYDIIKDGCSVDSDDTLQFHDSPDNQSQRWSLEAFQYVGRDTFVFFHCEVQICDAADPASRCAQGCVQRRRRSEGVLHDNPGNKYALAQGPIALNRENREVEAVALDESKPKVNTGFNIPVVASLGVFIGFCIVGMAWLKITSDRKRVAKQFIPLYEDLQK